jgi:transcriptional regulator of acetoin/glycerol metabolism
MLTEGRILSEREVLAALGTGSRSPGREGRTSSVPEPPKPVTVLDRQALERALQQVGGNRSAAARLLGVSRRAFYRRLETFGLR